MTVKVQADLAQVQARLAKIKAEGGDTGKAVRAFGSVVLNRIKMGFRLGRSPRGQSWLPLKLRDGQPLRNTGALMQSITMQAVPGGVEIGTNRIGARVHQFGATIKPKNGKFLRIPGNFSSAGATGPIFTKQVTIPARPFMPMTASGGVDLPPAWIQSGLDAMKKALDL